MALLRYRWVVLMVFALSCRNPQTVPDQEWFRNNLVFIQGGEFVMGDSLEGCPTEKPGHKVRVSSFYLQTTEVTVEQFRKFVESSKYLTDAEKRDSSLAFFKGKWQLVKGVNWRFDASGKMRPEAEFNHPVVHVSWNDANAYCAWLSRQTGHTFRLPTEAEWEYAARNRGNDLRYSWGNSLPPDKNGGNIADSCLLKEVPASSIVGSYSDGYVFTAPVGCFNPNPLGLSDMTGNVWEWCNDWYAGDYYAKSAVTDPAGPVSGTLKTFRGGCWFSDASYLKITFRQFGNMPDQSYGDFGFRVAMIP